MKPCPDEAELLHFVDGALPLEEAEDVRAHAAQCSRCGARVHALRTLLGDLSAVDLPYFDARDHARAVRDRIDRLERAAPRSEKRRPSPMRTFMWAGGSLAAAVLVVVALGRRAPSGAWQARGGMDPWAGASVEAGLQGRPYARNLRRDVGVRVYAAASARAPRVAAPTLGPLVDGAVIPPDAPLATAFRNLGPTAAFLLLFAVDERQKLHWISPAFTRREDNPPSTALPSAVEERLLPTTAVLEDVPAGALRIVAVITEAPAHVSDVEGLEGSDVGAERIERAIPGADVRETRVEVVPEANPRHP